MLGTLNVLTAAQRSDVDAFVNISTDKASQPVPWRAGVLQTGSRAADRRSRFGRLAASS